MDFVLLEWALMLALVDAGLLKHVYPLVLGDSFSNSGLPGTVTTFEEVIAFVNSAVPEIVPTKTYDELAKFLQTLDITTPPVRRGA